MIASVLDWAAERFQDALGSADLGPGLVHRKPFDPARRGARIEEFIQLLFGGSPRRVQRRRPLGPPEPPAPGEEAGA